MTRICIAGKNRVAVDAAEFVVSLFGKSSLCVLINSTDAGIDTWQPSLKKWAETRSIPVVSLEDLYALEELVFFSLEYERIVDPAKFRSERLFNVHFSLLPEYKGAHTSFWPILDGKEYSGVTLHRIDAGIDTGDIIHQERFEISLQDTCRDLYEKYLTVGTRIFQDWAQRLVRGEFTVMRQPVLQSSFRSRKSLDFKNITIETKQTAFNIHNQIRAFVFREYQMPSLFGQRISGSEMTEIRSTAKPGTLVEETDSTLQLATIDYDLRVFKDPFEKLLEFCRQGTSSAALEHCLDLSPSLNLRDSHGWTPLIVAAYHYNTPVVRRLIEKGADCNQANYKGTTVLMYAKSSPSRNGDLTLLEWLIDRGAEVNRRDLQGLTVLSYAKREGDGPLVRFLCSKGAAE